MPVKAGEHQTNLVRLGVVLSVIALAGLIYGGSYAYRHFHTAKLGPSVSLIGRPGKTYIDPSRSFELSYPSGWSESITALGDFERTGSVSLDNANIDFTPSNAPLIQTNPDLRDFIQVTAYRTSNMNQAMSAFVSSGCNGQIQKQLIRGYVAEVLEQTCGLAPSYVKYVYAVEHHGITVIFTFDKESSAVPSNTNSYRQPAFNASYLSADVTRFVDSIRFINP